MNVILPPPNSSMGTILQSIREAFIRVVSQDQAADRILLRSPGGKVYAVTVDDAGVLKTEAVNGKARA